MGLSDYLIKMDHKWIAHKNRKKSFKELKEKFAKPLMFSYVSDKEYRDYGFLTQVYSYNNGLQVNILDSKNTLADPSRLTAKDCAHYFLFQTLDDSFISATSCVIEALDNFLKNNETDINGKLSREVFYEISRYRTHEITKGKLEKDTSFSHYLGLFKQRLALNVFDRETIRILFRLLLLIGQYGKVIIFFETKSGLRTYMRLIPLYYDIHADEMQWLKAMQTQIEHICTIEQYEPQFEIEPLLVQLFKKMLNEEN